MSQKSQSNDLYGLKDLLDDSSSAKTYFSSLPPLIKETMMMSHQNIRSEEELRSCAHNMMQGDR